MQRALFWFRRDLRVRDNAGLHAALASAQAVSCVFIFDRDILDPLPNRADRRVEFVHASVAELAASIAALGGTLSVLHAHACIEIPRLAEALGVEAVYANEDYEPRARARDDAIAKALSQRGIDFRLSKDTVIFAKAEILTQAGQPFSVFTPYKRAWLKRLAESDRAAYPVGRFLTRTVPTPMPSLKALGFLPTDITQWVTPGERGAQIALADFVERMQHYQARRDYPAQKGVSYLSVHNRFGTVSIRELVRAAYVELLRGANAGAETWLSELIWREFYFQILWHHPHVAHGAFRPRYDALRWHNDPAHFAAWCEARTGYPIIDAAMRQINQTGYMHNRLRMIVASFLTKDLLIDWRWGEKYFADHLNDFDLAANNGGWQWAASTGCDAQPYFRIFNPVTQSERFDPDGKFIRRYLPELNDVPDKFIHAPWLMPTNLQSQHGIGHHYPLPIVEHARQREKALAIYKAVREK